MPTNPDTCDDKRIVFMVIIVTRLQHLARPSQTRRHYYSIHTVSNSSVADEVNRVYFA